MPKRIAKQTVTVLRDGERLEVPLNKPFEFTDEEIEHFTEHAPGALSRIAIFGDQEEAVSEEEIDEEAAPEIQEGVTVKKTVPPKPAAKAKPGAKKPAKPKAGDDELKGL